METNNVCIKRKSDLLARILDIDIGSSIYINNKRTHIDKRKDRK